MFRFIQIGLLFLSISSYAQTYKELVHKRLSELTVEQVNQTMLTRLNEMRAELKLKPLQYSYTIEKVGFYLMDHKTKWFKEDGGFDPYCHFDDDNNGVSNRFKLLNIQFEMKVISEKRFKGGGVYTRSEPLAGENLITTNGSVYVLCEAWRKSPGHWAPIIEKDFTHLGIAYRKDCPVLICNFIKFKSDK